MVVWSKEVFARNLRYYMERKGKNQRELAEIIGVSAPTMNDWINAKKYPRIDKIEMLANYFGILKSDLIEEKKIGDVPEDADFHAKILMDKEVLEMLEVYYSLNNREREIVRNFVHGLKPSEA